MGVASVFAAYLALLVLAIASGYDLAKREVPARLMYVGFVASLALSLVEATVGSKHPPVAVIVYGSVVNGIILLAVYVLVRLKMMGEGDLVAYGLVWASTLLDPLGNCCILPLAFTVVAYSVAAQALLAIGFLCYNLVFSREELAKLPTRLRVVYALTAIPLPAWKAVSMKGWWFPLTYCDRMLTSFNIDEDPQKARERLRGDIESGCISPSSVVWVTYGIPAVPFIALGLVLALSLGDHPIWQAISMALGVEVECIG
jgi:Flp pilus assembly protein protease CpaA